MVACGFLLTATMKSPPPNPPLLNGAADAEGKKNFRFDVLSRLADQNVVAGPSGVHHRPGRADVSAQEFRQFVELPEIVFIAQAAAAADDHVGIFDGVLPLHRAFVLDLAHARGRQLGGQRQTLDRSGPFAVVGNLPESAGTHGGHLRPVLFRNDLRQHVAAERGRDLHQQAVGSQLQPTQSAESPVCSACEPGRKLPAEVGRADKQNVRILSRTSFSIRMR